MDPHMPRRFYNHLLVSQKPCGNHKRITCKWKSFCRLNQHYSSTCFLVGKCIFWLIYVKVMQFELLNCNVYGVKLRNSHVLYNQLIPLFRFTFYRKNITARSCYPLPLSLKSKKIQLFLNV